MNDEIERLCLTVHERLEADDAAGAVELMMAMPLKTAGKVGDELGFPGTWLVKSKPSLRKILEQCAPFKTRSAREARGRQMAKESILSRVRHTVEACEMGQTLVDVSLAITTKHGISALHLMNELTDGNEQLLRDKYEFTKAELTKNLADLVPGDPEHDELKRRGEALLAETFEDFVKRMTPGFGFGVLKDRQKPTDANRFLPLYLK